MSLSKSRLQTDLRKVFQDLYTQMMKDAEMSTDKETMKSLETVANDLGASIYDFVVSAKVEGTIEVGDNEYDLQDGKLR